MEDYLDLGSICLQTSAESVVNIYRPRIALFLLTSSDFAITYLLLSSTILYSLHTSTVADKVI